MVIQTSIAWAAMLGVTAVSLAMIALELYRARKGERLLVSFGGWKRPRSGAGAIGP